MGLHGADKRQKLHRPAMMESLGDIEGWRVLVQDLRRKGVGDRTYDDNKNGYDRNEEDNR